jgi:flavin reductase (DIM6/NTAB) family NADH-FMN oxidoreductase RutF
VDADSSLIYRRALGTFATGVTVVTAEDAVGPLGLTVNSFTSVSLEPPLILWCMGDESDRRHLFSTTPVFVVNVLAAEDQEHSARFAWGACRLEPDDMDPSEPGLPRLRGALARFECSTRDRIQLGDHLVIVGEVTRFETREGDGLVFFRGRYGRVRSEEM